MVVIDSKVKEYIEKNIFPIYDLNDKGHGIDHILYVINRSLNFASTIDNINYNLVYVIAAYHDCGHHINPKEHEVISAEIMYNDVNLRSFFSEEEMQLMKEAIEDHRASLDRDPRSIYGKIVSSADRLVNVDIEIERTFEYRRNRIQKEELASIIEESRQYLIRKYVGVGSRTKMFFDDPEYYQHIEELTSLVTDKNRFVRQYKKINQL